MGMVYTPAFRIEYRDQAGWHTAHYEHRTTNPYRGLGKPSNAKAEAWRVTMNASFQNGGVNAHVRLRGNGIPHISHVRIIRQRTAEIVATAQMPMFEIV
jgi:hypothetical protein